MTGSGQSDTATASITPRAIGVLFYNGHRLIDCKLNGNTCVWEWERGLRLTLDTDANPPHFHVEVVE